MVNGALRSASRHLRGPMPRRRERIQVATRRDRERDDAGETRKLRTWIGELHQRDATVLVDDKRKLEREGGLRMMKMSARER